MDQGSFYRKLPVFLDGFLSPELHGPEIVGRACPALVKTLCSGDDASSDEPVGVSLVDQERDPAAAPLPDLPLPLGAYGLAG